MSEGEKKMKKKKGREEVVIKAHRIEIYISL